MKTLAEEILYALPALTRPFWPGPDAAQLASHLCAREDLVRAACHALHAQGAAIYARFPGSKSLRLLAPDHFRDGRRACAFCRTVFLPAYRAMCCSRTCSQKWSWSQPEARARREAALKAVGKSPGRVAALEAYNRLRWSDPTEHAKLSEQNRREWSDPQKAAQRAASIQAVHSAPEKRKATSERRKADWQKPGYRERASAGMREAKQRPEVRAKISESMKRRWADPEQRAKLTAANGARAVALAERNRGRKQSPEQIAKRVEATRQTKRERRS